MERAKNQQRDKSLEKFFVQDYVRQQLQIDSNLRQAMLFNESDAKKEPNDQTAFKNVKGSNSLVNLNGVKIKNNIGESRKAEMVKDLYQRIYAGDSKTNNQEINQNGGSIQITNINIGNVNNNVFVPTLKQVGSQHLNRRAIIQSRQSINRGSSTQRLQPSKTSEKRKILSSQASPRKKLQTPNNGLLTTAALELNEIFASNKDAKLANMIIQMHQQQISQGFDQEKISSSRDISHRQDFTSKNLSQRFLERVNPQAQLVNNEEKVAENQLQDQVVVDHQILTPTIISQHQVNQAKKSTTLTPLRFRSMELQPDLPQLNLINAKSHIDHLDQILLSKNTRNLEESNKITIEDQDSHHAGNLNKVFPSQQYLPTDMKHMEHIIQYSQPNYITKYGNVICQRKQCLDNFHSDQCLQKQIQMAASKKDLYYDEASRDEASRDENKQGQFEEECENFMRNLQKYYDKYIKNENAFIQKSHLESNMFSNKRRTIENLINHTPATERFNPHAAQEEEDAYKQEELNKKEQMIHRILGTKEELQRQKEAEKNFQNPYAQFFGSYDYHYYNSKVPQPQKESLGQPSGRKQVQLLNEWFERVMEQYVYNQKDFLQREDQRKKAFYFSKVILTICIRDLVRQVSVHCIERGAFMEKVLNIYLSIYEAELRVHLHDIDLQKEKHIEQIKNIREETRSQIVNFEKFIDNLNVKIKEISLQRDKHKSDLDSMRETLVKYQEMNSKGYNFNKKQSSFKDIHGILNRVGSKLNDGMSSQASPIPKRDQQHYIIEKSKDSEDSSQNKGYLAMKKTKIQNIAHEAIIVRQKGFSKNDNKRIRIADSSESLLTDEEGAATKKDKRSYSVSFQQSQDQQDMSEEEQVVLPQLKINKHGSQISKGNTFIQQNQGATNTHKRSLQHRQESSQSSFQQNLNNHPMMIQEEFELQEQDQQMISETIDMFFEAKAQPDQNEHNSQPGDSSDEDENNQKDNQYEKADQLNKAKDIGLEYIEHEQTVKLIGKISEITEKMYNQQKDGDEPTLDLSKHPSQKEFIKQIVEQVVKNNQQTIEMLLQRIHNEDRAAMQKLLDSVGLQNDKILNLVDLAKPGSLSKTNFIKTLQQRGEKNQSILRKALKDSIKDEKSGSTSKDAEMQTEDFHFIDFDQMSVETAEIYMFDRISRKLRKITVEIDPQTNYKVYKQFEFNYKGQQDDFLIHLKSSIAKKQEAEFKFKVETKNKHYEINRANRTLRSMLERISSLEIEINALENQRNQSAGNNSEKQQNNTAFQSVRYLIKHLQGYLKGFEQGRNAGYFKGYQEGRHFGHQLGFQDGVKEGWNFGFDDGYKNGIRRVFKECREAGINIDGLDMMEYISKGDQFVGLKKFAFEKLFKIIAKNEKLQQVYKLHDRFMQFNEKRKKHFAKMGRKNIIKMIAQLFLQMINSWQNSQQSSSWLGILEYMYDEYCKKYGNIKLAEKKIYQILGSTYYHLDSHPKIAFFGQCLHITKNGWSNDLLFFYLQTIDRIYNSNVGINIKQDDRSDIDIIAYLKALDGAKIIFEDKIPVEAYGRIRQDIEKYAITKDRAKVVDFDKLLEHFMANYLRYCTLLTPAIEQLYHAFTLYENFFMTYNELMMLVTMSEIDKVKIDNSNAPSETRYIEIEKKEFTNHNISICKEQLSLLLSQVSLTMDDLFRGQKWKTLKFLESKDCWLSRFLKIERSVSTLHIHQVMLAAFLYTGILQHYLAQKRELYGDGHEDEDEVDLLEIYQLPTTNQETNEAQITSSQTMKLSHVKKQFKMGAAHHHQQTLSNLSQPQQKSLQDSPENQQHQQLNSSGGESGDEELLMDEMLDMQMQQQRRSTEGKGKGSSNKLTTAGTMNFQQFNTTEKLSNINVRRGTMNQPITGFGKKKPSQKIAPASQQSKPL